MRLVITEATQQLSRMKYGRYKYSGKIENDREKNLVANIAFKKNSRLQITENRKG